MSKARVKIDGVLTISEAEMQCLRSVRDYLKKFSVAPTFDELADIQDKAKTNVRRTLDRLTKKGLVTRDLKKRRSLAITESGLAISKMRLAKKGTV